jgi:nucleolar pre-ribosomal-associated protein 2
MAFDLNNASSTQLLLALDCCRVTLVSHPKIVNQSVLDRLVANISTMVSGAHRSEQLLAGEKPSSQPKAADIYQRVCSIIGVILGRHRRRLADRYHLLIPVLQGLLRALFWPGTDSVGSMQQAATATALNTFGKTIPTWLRTSTEALPAEAAQQFTRLLSSICNPTVSAARQSSKRGRNELNDETKKARLFAGQQMQYLIMEYARSTLDGQINPLVKEHLMPGLYAVLDAMDRDLMRALNSGMDPSSRAIFKTLYDDWCRYGRWDKS